MGGMGWGAGKRGMEIKKEEDFESTWKATGI